MRIPLLGLCFAVAVSTRSAQAQSRWKEIGKTSAGNSVLVDTRSVKTSNGITFARIEVKFTQPVDAGGGVHWYVSRHDAMFDCAKRYIATKSNVYYGDAAATKVVRRDVNKIPGFGPPIGGSMTQIAVDYFCRK